MVLDGGRATSRALKRTPVAHLERGDPWHEPKDIGK